MKIVNRQLALLLALALIAAGTILIIEVIADRAGTRTVVIDWHRIYEWAARTSWGAWPIRTAGGVLAVVGLALLTAQIRRRRPKRLAVTSDNDATDIAITRSGVANSIRHAIDDLDGVSGARVNVRQRITVHARTRAAQPTSEPDAVANAARSAVDALQLRRPPPVSVRVATQER
jgi:hypothetical protein